MRTMAILLASVAMCQAQSLRSNEMGLGTLNTTTNSGSLIVCSGDDCPRDLVIRTKDDKTVLIRRVIGCEASAMRLKQCNDVIAAECFK